MRRRGIWLLIAVSFLASAGFVQWRMVGPSDGAPISFYTDAWMADGVRMAVAHPVAGGLRTGDVVVAVNGRSVSEWLADAFAFDLGRHAPGPSNALIYTVQRDGDRVAVMVRTATQDMFDVVAQNWANLLFALVLLAVALYVLRRRPDLSASGALAIAAAGAGASITPWLLGLNLSDIYFRWPFLVHTLTVTLIYMLMWPSGAIHLPLAMAGPHTRLPAPTRRVLAVVYGVPLGAYALGLAITRLTAPSLTAWIGTWSTLQALVVVPTVIVGLTVAAVAFARATPETKRQIRWAFIGGAFATVVGLSLLFVPQLVSGRPLVSWNIVGLFALPLPVGLAFAIVRHRMFDIEVVVNRTLVYGGVTLAIIFIYLLTVVILTAFVPEGGGFPASLVATGLAAVAALPARDALQRGVNRLMYGDRDEPYRALARLAQRLESTIEPLAIPSAVVASVAEALRLPYVALEIGPADAVELTAAHGTPVGDPLEIALVYNAEHVGRLLLAPRAPGEAFSPSDLRLLDDLARSAGAAVHSVRLTVAVVRARERLVVAREEERRRIRRDLHDGLGPTLAAIGMRAEVAADLAVKDPGAAEQTLQQMRTEVNGALAEIRRLVDGLRPPALDEVGLVGAIEAQAALLGPQPHFEVRAENTLPELPAAIEVAAYRIAVEAMTNAARHAAAKEVRVVIELGAEPLRSLRVEIADDGRGVPDEPRAGIGLVSMRERAAEVGGTLDVVRGHAGGTTVTARLPLAVTA